MVCRNVWFRGRFGEFAVPLMRKRAEWSWRLRWGSILSCAAARAVAASLLELPRASNGADEEVPHLHEVERDLHVAGRLE